jgi:hypothetical protein
MERYQQEIASKINELSNYGYINHFDFSQDHLELKRVKDDESVEVKNYVAEQVSVEAEYVYEEKGTAVVTLMTNDGELGYVIDHSDANGEFPAIRYFESLED